MPIIVPSSFISIQAGFSSEEVRERYKISFEMIEKL
jgi:hypothetical protein